MRCAMKTRAGALAVLGIALSACVGGELQLPKAEPTIYPPAVYAHRVQSSHVALYWNCSWPEPGLLRVEGVAHNPWSPQEIRFLEFDLAGVDSHERIVSQARGEARDFLLHMSQITPFRLELRTAGSEVRFDLFYQYRFHEGDRDRLIAGPLAGRPLFLVQTKGFMARDICSESQHRVR